MLKTDSMSPINRGQDPYPFNNVRKLVSRPMKAIITNPLTVITVPTILILDSNPFRVEGSIIIILISKKIINHNYEII